MTIRNVSSLKGYQKLNKNKNNWIKYTKYHINKGWFDTGWVYIIILADISFLNTNIYIKYIVLSVRQQEYLLRIFYLDVQSHSTIVYWLTFLFVSKTYRNSQMKLSKPYIWQSTALLRIKSLLTTLTQTLLNVRKESLLSSTKAH